MNSEFCQLELRDTVYRALIENEDFIKHIKEVFTHEIEYGLFPYITITSSHYGDWWGYDAQGECIDFVINIFVQSGGSKQAWYLLERAKAIVGAHDFLMENHEGGNAVFINEDVVPLLDGVTYHAFLASRIDMCGAGMVASEGSCKL